MKNILIYVAILLFPFTVEAQHLKEAFLLENRDWITAFREKKGTASLYKWGYKKDDEYDTYRSKYAAVYFTYYYRQDLCIGFLLVKPYSEQGELDYLNKNFVRIEDTWYDTTTIKTYEGLESIVGWNAELKTEDDKRIILYRAFIKHYSYLLKTAVENRSKLK